MPKRKAPARISGLVDSDDEAVDSAVASHPESHDERPAKKSRGRPKSTGVKADEQSLASKPSRTSSAALVKQNGTTKRVSNRGRPRATTAILEGSDGDTEDDLQTEDDAVPESAHEEEAIAAEVSPARKRRGRPRELDSNAKQTHVTEDGEFEYTPTGSRQFKSAEESAKHVKLRGRQRKSDLAEDAVIPDSQNPISDALVDKLQPSDKRPSLSSPLKSLTNGERPGRKRPTVTFADTVEKASSDPELRRKLGDMTKKYEALEVKFRNLREIGVVEANANFEKIRKQCESVTNGEYFEHSIYLIIPMLTAFFSFKQTRRVS